MGLRAPGLGVAHELGAAVGRVRHQLDDPEVDHVADHLTHRLPGDTRSRARSAVRCPPAPAGAENRVVGGLDHVVALAGPPDHVGLQRTVRLVRQRDERHEFRGRQP